MATADDEWAKGILQGQRRPRRSVRTKTPIQLPGRVIDMDVDPTDLLRLSLTVGKSGLLVTYQHGDGLTGRTVIVPHWLIEEHGPSIPGIMAACRVLQDQLYTEYDEGSDEQEEASKKKASSKDEGTEPARRPDGAVPSPRRRFKARREA